MFIGLRRKLPENCRPISEKVRFMDFRNFCWSSVGAKLFFRFMCWWKWGRTIIQRIVSFMLSSRSFALTRLSNNKSAKTRQNLVNGYMDNTDNINISFKIVWGISTDYFTGGIKRTNLLLILVFNHNKRNLIYLSLL